MSKRKRPSIAGQARQGGANVHPIDVYCPHCGAAPGKPCTQPKGAAHRVRERPAFHLRRWWAADFMAGVID